LIIEPRFIVKNVFCDLHVFVIFEF